MIAGRWRALPEAATARYKEVPNFLRPVVGLEMKGNGSDRGLPMELQVAFEKGSYYRKYCM